MLEFINGSALAVMVYDECDRMSATSSTECHHEDVYC